MTSHISHPQVALGTFSLEQPGRHIKQESLVEGDEDRLAMKRGDMPPPLPRLVPNPRIRDDRAQHEIFSNSDKVHRADPEDAYTQAWFEYSRSIFQQSVGKTSTNVKLYNVST